MPSNDERREVAENLRIMTACGCRYAEQFYELLQETIMNVEDFHDFWDVANRLADLIEPELERTCHVIDVNESGVGVCDHCGGYAEAVDNYCPNCGYKVVE